MTRLEEVMSKFGSRPVMAEMSMVGDDFGEPSPYRVDGSTAIICINGPLSNDPDAEEWGGTSYGSIQAQIRTASADTNAKGILLVFNTPGGETDNAFETSAAIAKAGTAKPVYGVAATSCYSGGMLLAAPCMYLFCTPTSGGMGSVGVYSAHFDISEMLKKQGVDVTLTSAGAGKTNSNPYQPLTAEAKAERQASVDRLYGEFVMAVANGRAMAPNDVIALGARLYQGSQAAINAGLADASGDITDAWVAIESSYDSASVSASYPVMARRVAIQASKGATQISIPVSEMPAVIQAVATPAPVEVASAIAVNVASATNSNKEHITMPESQVVAAEPKTFTAAEVATLTAQARAEGVEVGRSEAAEISDLCSIAGHPERVAEFVGAKATPATVRKTLIDAKATAGSTKELGTASTPGAVPPGATAVALPADEAKAATTARAWTDVPGVTTKKGKV